MSPRERGRAGSKPLPAEWEQGVPRRGRARAPGSGRPARGPGRPDRRSADWAPRLLAQTALLAGVFAVTTLVAELAGAANLGVALGIGQVAFAIALVALMLTR